MLCVYVGGRDPTFELVAAFASFSYLYLLIVRHNNMEDGHIVMWER
jgi:hypothetical protein